MCGDDLENYITATSRLGKGIFVILFEHIESIISLYAGSFWNELQHRPVAKTSAFSHKINHKLGFSGMIIFRFLPDFRQFYPKICGLRVQCESGLKFGGGGGGGKF